MEDRDWGSDSLNGLAWTGRNLDALARPTILLIEDEQDILDLLVLLLEQSGFSCVAARTAEDGLEQLREQAFDLVLADYSLPHRSAGWMLRQAGTEGLLSATPVLIVTAHPEPHDVDGFEVIRKPFDLDQLVDRVKQRLERGTPRPRSSRPASKPALIRPSGTDGHGAHSNGGPHIELILYISSHSPRSAAAVNNLKQAIARFRNGRVKLTICDLASDPTRGTADSVAFTPTLVKRAPGPRTFILGHLTSPDLLLELLESCGGPKSDS